MVSDGESIEYDRAKEKRGYTMDRNEALAKFTDDTVEVLAVDPAQVTLEASFGDDLGADSLDLVELVMALEETFDIEVAEDELKEIKTVGEAFELIYAKL
jgi:acyl carrier protein